MMNRNNNRVILFHKHPSSARVRFLFFTDRNSVLAFDSLPDLASVMDSSSDIGENQIESSILSDYFGEVAESIIFDDEFYTEVDVPNETIGVLLARFGETDPPFEFAEKINAEFRELTATRSVAPVELVLLQKAYTQIMG